MNGNNIREANNNNYAYLNVPALNRRMEAAASLTGAKRYAAYSKLDLDITKNYAPWASYMYANNRDFVSAKVGCYSYHPTYAMNLRPGLPALTGGLVQGRPFCRALVPREGRERRPGTSSESPTPGRPGFERCSTRGV